MNARLCKMILCCSVFALALAGCANDAEAPAVQQEERAAGTAEPVMVQTIINSGISLEDESWKMAREGGEVFVERWSNGVLSQIAHFSREPLITPPHLGHDLDAENYAIDADYLCWLEWPAPPDAQDGNWYIYLQPRDGGEAHLLDEGVYSYERQSVRSNWLSLDYEAGNVIWVKPDGDFQIKLYRAATGETTELDRSSQMGSQVAVGKEDAVWTKTAEDNAVTVMHCDLTTGEVSQLAYLKEEQEWMTDPVICGHYLLMIHTWEEAVCVYDLDSGEWTARIDVAPPAFADYGLGLMGRPIVLDDEHVALTLQATAQPYQLPLLDLASGTVYLAEFEPYTPLYMVPEDVDAQTLEALGSRAICDIQPVSYEAGTNAVEELYLTEDGIERTVLSVDIHW